MGDALGDCFVRRDLIAAFAARANGSGVWIGGQDCSAEDFGAFTGDVSAPMLADAGARAVIVGHSERRTYHQETDAQVCAKALSACRAGLTAIVCIGETEFERQAGATLSRLERQLDESLPDNSKSDNLVVAYEPVWAIGTGRTPNVFGRGGRSRVHPQAAAGAVWRRGRGFAFSMAAPSSRRTHRNCCASTMSMERWWAER